MARFGVAHRLAMVVATCAVLAAPRAAAQTEATPPEVDLALVIAVDISYSMDPDEQALQREGFADAFRSREVQDAIRRGAVGRIAVTYVEWAGSLDQRIVVPWTVLDNPETILAFAERVASTPMRRAQRTSISGAIDFAVKLVEASGFPASRRVIDVSGDGPNNQGRPVVPARDDAVSHGLTINGLPLMLKAPGYFDIPDLDIYYRDCVIGGLGAFIIPARDKAQFQQAIKTKILLEVAGREPQPDEPLLKHAETSERANCLAGETQWRERMGN